MGRKPKNLEKDDTQVDEQAEETIVVEDQPKIFNEVALDSDSNSDENLEEVPEEKPVQIASKQFVKILKEEFKKENISESVYIAFLASVPKVNWEKDYRLIWETTFKRPPIEKQTPVQEK